MRLFTALSLPPSAVAALGALADRMGTPQEKLHITTKFIGEWPEVRLRELQEALGRVAVIAPVDVQIRGFLWMGSALCAGVRMSSEIHLATEEQLAALGIPRETRVYSPHVTLGRGRRASVPVQEIDMRFRAACFHLYLSAGGTYTKLSDYPLPS